MKDEDLGWDELAGTWTEGDSPVFDTGEFHHILRRRRLATSVVVAGELALTAGLVWGTRWLAGPATIGADTVFLTGFWLFWAVATVFAWWNRRGQWQLSVASSEDFVRLSLDRAEKKIRVAWFTAGLLLAQVTFVLSFWAFGRDHSAGGAEFGTLLAVLGIVTAGYAGWTTWYYRRARSERDHLTALGEPGAGEYVI